MVYDARRGVVEVLAGQGAAPRLATLDAFRERGGIPAKGIESAAVPAALDACLTALGRFGTRTFAEVVAPTLRLLDAHEKDWHADLAATLRRLVEAEAASPGDRLRGLRLVADAFYRGPIAREIDAWSRAHGGLLRASDLATHVTRIEEPVAIEYRGHTVYKCGPWTQGPALLEALQLLEGFDLKAIGHNRPDAVHLTVEALKLALADRDVYYADPLFEDVPLAGLLAPEYASGPPRPDRPEAGVPRAAAGRPARGQGAPGRVRGPPRPGRPDVRHDHLPGRRPLRQRGRGHPQRLVGRGGGEDRRLARHPPAELQPLARPPQPHRAGQAPPDHAHPHPRPQGGQARPGHQRGGGRQPGPDDAPARCSTTSTSASPPPSR